jgi:hypothetical protein
MGNQKADVAVTEETPEVTLESASEGISQQDLIRRLFLSGGTRAQIHKALGIRYQIVYKGTNPEFAPKELRAALEVELAQERANRLVALEG